MAACPPSPAAATTTDVNGDVRVGFIAIRSGIPNNQAPWGWRCGFYPGSEPGEYTSGTATTFDQARADFEKAWQS
jgi:hypothetical protein